jgi:hypothetical protein
MKDTGRLVWLLAGLLLGVAGTAFYLGQPRAVEAANDRNEDYAICTGHVAVNARAQTDGVWLLDYRSGKLLATVIDRTQAKILGWAELDLVDEFGVAPKQAPRFLMTTGQISPSQAALYVAEANTGKFGVYTLQQRPDGQAGFAIIRHDLVLFRQAPAAGK